MTNEEIIERMNEALAKHGAMDKSIKFDLGEDGQIHLEGAAASTDDREADCTIAVSKADFIAVAKRELDPMAAFMSGRLKISGDMSVAMGLQSLFS